MKIRHFLPLAALALPLLASARPAATGLRTLMNADGSSIEAYVNGDEAFSWVVSADGKTLLEYNGNRWAPAVRNGITLKAQAENIQLLRDETPDFYVENPENPKKRMAYLDNTGRTTYPCLGETRGLVVLIEFADTKFTVPNPKQAFEAMCNEEGYSKYGGKGSARDYYIATSNGKFKPTFDVVGPVAVSENAEYYIGAGSGMPGEGSNAFFGYALDEALKKLDGEVDFSQYDYDNDGKIDNIFFFYAGYGQADSPYKNTIWPHQSDFARYCYSYTLGLSPIYLDGKQFATYACSNELLGGKLPEGESHPYLDGVGAFIHEYAHVLGLPDLYDPSYDKSTQTPGYWDVMANGTYNDNSTRPPLFNGYEQWCCKWLEYTDIAPDSEGHYDIPSLSKAIAENEEPTIYRFRMKRPGLDTYFGNEYFVMENRTLHSWDSALPGDGILIWHIDYDRTKWMNNEVNYQGRSRLVPVLTNDGSTVWPGLSDQEGSIIYKGGLNELPVNTVGASFEAVISGITYDQANATGSFDINIIKQIEDVTVLHQPEIVSAASREFRLSWDKVEGVSNYFLTVERLQGTRYYTVDGYDNKAVGDINEVIVRNISPSAWSQNMRAFVRCGNEIPSAKTSNTVSFNPNNMSSSVADIEMAEVVRGEQGRIEAPAGARVFNAAGMETGTENLPAGMYIVSLDGKSVKVVVK